MIKAIIFDMDGVLLDTEPVHERAVRQCMEEDYGAKLTKKIISRVRGMVDREEFALYKKIFGIADSIENMSSNKDKRFFSMIRNTDVLFDGVPETLRKLRKDYVLALTTSTSGAKFDYETGLFGLKDFKVVTNGDDVSKGKPDPECYIRTVKRLGLAPEECVVVEDAVNGVIAAKAAGVWCIGLRGTFPSSALKAAGADIIVGDIREITYDRINTLGGLKTGFRIALASGTFDIFHPGHEYYLRKAKAAAGRNGRLVVIIARDSTVKMIKGRAPLNDEGKRAAAVRKSGIPDIVVLGSKIDFLEPVRRIKPDVICLGYDQREPEGLRRMLSEELPFCKVIRIGAYNPEKFKSSRIRVWNCDK